MFLQWSRKWKLTKIWWILRWDDCQPRFPAILDMLSNFPNYGSNRKLQFWPKLEICLFFGWLLWTIVLLLHKTMVFLRSLGCVDDIKMGLKLKFENTYFLDFFTKELEQCVVGKKVNLTKFLRQNRGSRIATMHVHSMEKREIHCNAIFPVKSIYSKVL